MVEEFKRVLDSLGQKVFVSFDIDSIAVRSFTENAIVLSETYFVAVLNLACRHLFFLCFDCCRVMIVLVFHVLVQ